MKINQIKTKVSALSKKQCSLLKGGANEMKSKSSIIITEDVDAM